MLNQNIRERNLKIYCDYFKISSPLEHSILRTKSSQYSELPVLLQKVLTVYLCSNAGGSLITTYL